MNLPDMAPIEVEYVENNKIQPFTFTCPHCRHRIYGDPPQITLNCPSCGINLIRKDFENVDIWAKKKD